YHPGLLIACCRKLKPAPHARAVPAIDIAELALEIGFLVGHHTKADDEGEGHKHRKKPEIVKAKGKSDEPQHHAKVDGIAGKAEGAALDDGRDRSVGGNV